MLKTIVAGLVGLVFVACGTRNTSEVNRQELGGAQPSTPRVPAVAHACEQARSILGAGLALDACTATLVAIDDPKLVECVVQALDRQQLADCGLRVAEQVSFVVRNLGKNNAAAITKARRVDYEVFGVVVNEICYRNGKSVPKGYLAVTNVFGSQGFTLQNARSTCRAMVEKNERASNGKLPLTIAAQTETRLSGGYGVRKPIPATNLDFEIIESEELGPAKLSLSVRVKLVDGRLPNEDEIAQLSRHLVHTHGPHERSFVLLYLPGMEAGAGAFATAHHNPELKVEYLEHMLDRYPRYKKLLAP